MQTTMHASQPSSAFAFLSSHSSPGPITPSPQTLAAPAPAEPPAPTAPPMPPAPMDALPAAPWAPAPVASAVELVDAPPVLAALDAVVEAASSPRSYSRP